MLLVWFIGLITGFVGAVLILVFLPSYNDCHSSTGVFARAFLESAKNQCEFVDILILIFGFLVLLGILAVVCGALMFISGFLLKPGKK